MEVCQKQLPGGVLLLKVFCKMFQNSQVNAFDDILFCKIEGNIGLKKKKVQYPLSFH